METRQQIQKASSDLSQIGGDLVVAKQLMGNEGPDNWILSQPQIERIPNFAAVKAYCLSGGSITQATMAQFTRQASQTVNTIPPTAA